jgi:hypothetical protein
MRDAKCSMFRLALLLLRVILQCGIQKPCSLGLHARMAAPKLDTSPEIVTVQMSLMTTAVLPTFIDNRTPHILASLGPWLLQSDRPDIGNGVWKNTCKSDANIGPLLQDTEKHASEVSQPHLHRQKGKRNATHRQRHHPKNINKHKGMTTAELIIGGTVCNANTYHATSLQKCRMPTDMTSRHSCCNELDMCVFANIGRVACCTSHVTMSGCCLPGLLKV